jgi:hypothetical protein
MNEGSLSVLRKQLTAFPASDKNLSLQAEIRLKKFVSTTRSVTASQCFKMSLVKSVIIFMHVSNVFAVMQCVSSIGRYA